MPRRNNRFNAVVDIDMSVVNAEQPKRIKSAREMVEERRDAERREDRNRRILALKNRNEMNSRSVNWKSCLVPTCGGRPVWDRDLGSHDSTKVLPLCFDHLTVAWGQGQRSVDAADEVFINEVNAKRADAHDEQVVKEARERDAFKARRDGHLYFLRLNGLIKVGWSRDVQTRLRAYGPEVKVLVICPGTRDDETNMHRQLRPSLARGREWYHDDAILARFVDDLRKQHGAPQVYDEWTRPKRPLDARPKGWARSA